MESDQGSSFPNISLGTIDESVVKDQDLKELAQAKKFTKGELFYNRFRTQVEGLCSFFIDKHRWTHSFSKVLFLTHKILCPRYAYSIGCSIAGSIQSDNRPASLQYYG